ncbi:hypothetical protein [Shewanella waksmanii]|uniref:hypothetical protein n=1 Tax=Shewanella waksmanii TaxID=213783 RepID=UPI003735DC65
MEELNLIAQADIATANAKGFVSSAVVNPILVDQYQSEDFSFCLREIGVVTPAEAKDNTIEPPHYLTHMEAYSIMLGVHDGGSGLALMPLYKVPQEVVKKSNIEESSEAQAKIVVKLLGHIGLPLGITVWIDIESINALSSQPENKGFTAEQTKQYLKGLSDYILDSGFSVGYYYGNTANCSCPSETQMSASNILQSISCANGLGENQLHTISIGDNNDSCKIRWAYYK